MKKEVKVHEKQQILHKMSQFNHEKLKSITQNRLFGKYIKELIQKGKTSHFLDDKVRQMMI